MNETEKQEATEIMKKLLQALEEAIKTIKSLQEKLAIATLALEEVSANKTQTIYNSSEEFMTGANCAFGQSAELAVEALAKIKDEVKK